MGRPNGEGGKKVESSECRNGTQFPFLSSFLPSFLPRFLPSLLPASQASRDVTATCSELALHAAGQGGIFNFGNYPIEPEESRVFLSKKIRFHHKYIIW